MDLSASGTIDLHYLNVSRQQEASQISRCIGDIKKVLQSANHVLATDPELFCSCFIPSSVVTSFWSQLWYPPPPSPAGSIL
uniref:Uncharacterized protein n=1 Tax=Cyprinodon variegatus TaxID=28743 RepID=A0A3Q2CAT5_CYPVA